MAVRRSYSFRFEEAGRRAPGWDAASWRHGDWAVGRAVGEALAGPAVVGVLGEAFDQVEEGSGQGDVRGVDRLRSVIHREHSEEHSDLGNLDFFLWTLSSVHPAPAHRHAFEPDQIQVITNTPWPTNSSVTLATPASRPMTQTWLLSTAPPSMGRRLTEQEQSILLEAFVIQGTTQPVQENGRHPRRYPTKKTVDILG